jgi:hypothetical protein
MGLDDVVYEMVRSYLFAQDPLPNLNKTYSTLVQAMSFEAKNNKAKL